MEFKRHVLSQIRKSACFIYCEEMSSLLAHVYLN